VPNEVTRFILDVSSAIVTCATGGPEQRSRLLPDAATGQPWRMSSIQTYCSRGLGVLYGSGVFLPSRRSNVAYGVVSPLKIFAVCSYKSSYDVG
jgi:hypothetical protein